MGKQICVTVKNPIIKVLKVKDDIFEKYIVYLESGCNIMFKDLNKLIKYLEEKGVNIK